MPPARYSEASLVKRLEELGIGRPSTYAPTITTVINRGYVVRESREGQKRDILNIKLSNGKITEKTTSETFGSDKHKLFPTDIGIVVTDYLDTQFPAILDYNFTASVEKEFDEIAEGELVWTKMIAKFYGDFHPTVEAALHAEHTHTTRDLGIDPATGLPVHAKIGRFGPYVQLGENEEVSGKKPKYANLGAGHLIATITLEEALELFKLPRTVGEYEGAEVSIGAGRFGPYVKHASKFVSLKKEDDPYSVTLERAVELIEEKRKQERERLIKTFDEDPEIQVLNGRWGPYLAKGKTNYKLPKGTDAPALTYEEAQKIMADQADKPAASRPMRKKR
jgi:DNA topoisomerase-1